MQTRLERWLAVPRVQANAAAAATLFLAMAAVIAFDEPQWQGEGTLLRGRAFIIGAVHAVFHGLALRGLKAMVAAGAPAAGAALAAYRDPRRISHLDLAAAWFALFAVAPLFVRG